jgi:hypothetical protein
MVIQGSKRNVNMLLRDSELRGVLPSPALLEAAARLAASPLSAGASAAEHQLSDIAQPPQQTPSQDNTTSHPAQQQVRRYAVVFSGSKLKAARVAAMLRIIDPGCLVDEVDIVNDQINQNVLKPHVVAKLIRELALQPYDALMISCECASFSIAPGGDESDSRGQLRSKSEVWGKTPIPPDWAWYLIKHNELTEVNFDLIHIMLVRQATVICEHPPDYGDRDTDHFWEEFEDWASLWDLPRARHLRSALTHCTFSQCAKGADIQGLTTLAADLDVELELDEQFGAASCVHGRTGHPKRARGRDEHGESNSAKKASYPDDMCLSLAKVMKAGAIRSASRRQEREEITKLLGTIHRSSAAQAQADLDDPECAMANLLPLQSGDDLEHAAFRFQWRLVCTLITHERADISKLAAAYGAGFRIGDGRHEATLPVAIKAISKDPHAKRRLGLAVKLACTLANGEDVNISSSSDTCFETTAWLVNTLAVRRAGSHRMHVGSAKPHASAHIAGSHLPTHKATPSGSLRQLEPELFEVLQGEAFPECNVPCRASEDEQLPRPPLVPGSRGGQRQGLPGPLTTAQLVPSSTYLAVKQHGEKVISLLKRARRGEVGHKVAMRQRPKRLVFEEHEALTPEAIGYHWIKRPTCDLWDVLLPSNFEHPPSLTTDGHTTQGPHLRFNGKQFYEDSVKHGMPDMQLAGWGITGSPGAQGMDSRRAVIWYPHGGAFEQAEHFLTCAIKDVTKRFVSPGSDFPIVWPCTVDPFNVVMRFGQPRLTIDKSIEQGKEPFAVKAYNSHVDLVQAEKQGLRVKMVRVSTFTRAMAIYLVCDAPFEIGKYDLQAFFRTHDKQLAQAHQHGGLTELGYRNDWRSNFGGKHEPDYNGRESNGQVFFIRIEFTRLDKEYESRHPNIIEWVRMRRQKFKDSGGPPEDEWRYTSLAFILFFVDDGGIGAFADVLFDRHGRMREQVWDVASKQHVIREVKRSNMYFDAATAISRKYGHGTPEEKMTRMCLYIVFLGIGICLTKRRRLLSHAKRADYSEECEKVLQSDRTLPNGLKTAPGEKFESLVHKLLHASEVIPLGRQHLFHSRECLKIENDLDWNGVIVTKKAETELHWWVAQMAKSDNLGLPLASRLEFPTVGDDDHVIEYHDASRELGNIESSGWGAWTTIRDVFYYIEGRWTMDEIEHYSINVLESKVRDMGTFTFVSKARELGCTATHATTFNDNRTSEANAEYGRPGTALLNSMLQEKQERAHEMGLHVANERVASIDNDIADLLSRGDIYEALRFPRTANMRVLRLDVEPSLREFAGL